MPPSPNDSTVGLPDSALTDAPSIRMAKSWARERAHGMRALRLQDANATRTSKARPIIIEIPTEREPGSTKVPIRRVTRPTQSIQ